MNNVQKEDLKNWKGCQRYHPQVIEGTFITIEPLDIEKHADELYDLTMEEGLAGRMKYLWEDVPKSREEFVNYLNEWVGREDRLCMVMKSKATQRIEARMCVQKIVLEHGKCELGPIYSYNNIDPRGLMCKHEAFFRGMEKMMTNLGYRRIEFRVWTKNFLSLKGTHRLGLFYEGTLRKNFVMKGENRDDAVFSITNDEWPFFKSVMDIYTAKENVNENGEEIRTMIEIREELLKLPEYKHISYKATEEFYRSLHIIS